MKRTEHTTGAAVISFTVTALLLFSVFTTVLTPALGEETESRFSNGKETKILYGDGTGLDRGAVNITLPYDEIGSIAAVTAQGERLEIIRAGRFVLPGTERLNEPLDEATRS